MFYKKEIDDYVQIQFIILYTLSCVKKAVSYDILINLILENCNISYTDFQIALSNLIETEHVRTFDFDGKPMYELEQKGIEANSFFNKKVPIYIKEPIRDSVKPLLKQETEKERIKNTITPIRENEFAAECGIYDDDKTPLLELLFYAGTREEATKIAERFSKNPEKIYSKILEILTLDD